MLYINNRSNLSAIMYARFAFHAVEVQLNGPLERARALCSWHNSILGARGFLFRRSHKAHEPVVLRRYHESDAQ